MRKYFLYFFFLILISTLSFIFLFSPDKVRFETILVANKFNISIPTYLSKTDSIDPAAILQYKNEKEQLFFLLYEKTDTAHFPIEGLFKKFSSEFISRIGHSNLVKYYPKEINSHHALIGNIRGTINETDVYYRIAIIKVDTVYYEIIMGVSENHFADFNDDMDQVLDSFFVLH